MDRARIQGMYLVCSRTHYVNHDMTNVQLVRREAEKACYYCRPLRTHERAVGLYYTFQEVCIPF